MNHYETEGEFVEHVLMGQRDAIDMANELFYISQVWDDLIDRDKPVPDNAINRMMWIALVDLPLNPFYQINFLALHPIVRAAIMDWMVATEIERRHEHTRELGISYIIRDSLTNILSHMAYLIGGYDWMVQISPEIRRWIHDENIGKYVAKVKAGKRHE